jgi:predicted kinase
MTPEAIIFVGIQGAGKSSFYKAKFFNSHMRINLDMLKTRYRETLLLRACIEGKQSFVVDNTNVLASERAIYIEAAKQAGFVVKGFYFRSSLNDALSLNRNRPEPQRVPDRGVLGTYKKLQIPQRTEGFDQLFYVTKGEEGDFVIEEWNDEV